MVYVTKRCDDPDVNRVGDYETWLAVRHRGIIQFGPSNDAQHKLPRYLGDDSGLGSAPADPPLHNSQGALHPNKKPKYFAWSYS